MKLTFSFDAIEEVRRQVEARHPHPEELSGDLTEGLVERILRILKETSLEDIPDIARGLSRQERFASVYAFVSTSKAQLRKKVAALLTAIPRKEHIPAGWQVALHHCSAPGYLETIRAVASGVQKAFTDFAPGHPSRILHRLLSEDLFAELLTELESTEVSVQEWIVGEALSGGGIPEDCELVRRLRLELLTQGTAATISRNPVLSIKTWAEEFRDREYRRFAAHYLTIYKPSKWAPPLVDDILERYGLPAAGHPFWNTVSEEVRRAFQRLVAGRKLNEFFSDVHDPEGRFAFWKTYLDHFTDLAFPRTKEQLFMAFNKFCVVEFRDHGNAAYFYRKSEVKWVRGAIGHENYELKDRQKAFHRLIHREDWQFGMATMMKRFLEQ